MPTNTIAGEQLKSIITRIEKLDEEKTATAQDIKDVYAEAKSQGFESKIIKMIVAMRKKDPSERKEQEALLDLYMSALGMTPTP